jgi:hypothetical protein
MLFMLVSRPKPGMKREQLIEDLTRQVHPETWDMIRHGELTNILYKVGDEPQRGLKRSILNFIRSNNFLTSTDA